MSPYPAEKVHGRSKRVCQLVDKLLLDIHRQLDDRRSSLPGSTDSRRSSYNFKKLSVFELSTEVSILRRQIHEKSEELLLSVRQRDHLLLRRTHHYDLVTACIQAFSNKTKEEAKMRFSLEPGETGFSQWLDAMKMVAQLPGGMPAEFRTKLWLQLSEKHLQDKQIDWPRTERIIFSEWSNPDDEELGVQIVKDLHRTGCSLFCGEEGEQNQALLKRVLLAYARWNKSVGYCQGFNMLAAIILQVMDRDEKNAVKVMIYLIDGVLPESYFANNLRGLSVDMAVFRDLMKLRLPKLSKHLDALQMDTTTGVGNSYEPPLTNVFTMQWFLTLFSNCLPQPTVLRVWDLVFLHGNEILLRTALAIWGILQDRVISVDSADEFYCIMGVVTRDMLEFGLMDANNLVKAIAMVDPFPTELQELREKYLYNISPWTQSVQSAARRGFRLFTSDNEEQDDTEDENTVKALAAAHGVFRRRESTKDIASMGPTLDIGMLKKQYAKMLQRQRQAHVIITAACSGSMSSPSVSVNHLLAGKSALVSKGKRIGPPKGAIPPSVTNTRSGKRSKPEETLQWNDAGSSGRQRTNHDRPNTITESSVADSFVRKEHRRSSSSSSSSTELCDDDAHRYSSDFDSEDTSDSCGLRTGSPAKKFLPSAAFDPQLSASIREVEALTENIAKEDGKSDELSDIRLCALQLVDDIEDRLQTCDRLTALNRSPARSSYERSIPCASTNYEAPSIPEELTCVPPLDMNIVNAHSTSDLTDPCENKLLTAHVSPLKEFIESTPVQLPLDTKNEPSPNGLDRECSDSLTSSPLLQPTALSEPCTNPILSEPNASALYTSVILTETAVELVVKETNISGDLPNDFSQISHVPRKFDICQSPAVSPANPEPSAKIPEEELVRIVDAICAEAESVISEMGIRKNMTVTIREPEHYIQEEQPRHSVEVVEKVQPLIDEAASNIPESPRMIPPEPLEDVEKKVEPLIEDATANVPESPRIIPPEPLAKVEKKVEPLINEAVPNILPPPESHPFLNSPEEKDEKMDSPKLEDHKQTEELGENSSPDLTASKKSPPRKVSITEKSFEKKENFASSEVVKTEEFAENLDTFTEAVQHSSHENTPCVGSVTREAITSDTAELSAKNVINLASPVKTKPERPIDITIPLEISDSEREIRDAVGEIAKLKIRLNEISTKSKIIQEDLAKLENPKIHLVVETDSKELAFTDNRSFVRSPPLPDIFQKDLAKDEKPKIHLLAGAELKDPVLAEKSFVRSPLLNDLFREDLGKFEKPKIHSVADTDPKDLVLAEKSFVKSPQLNDIFQEDLAKHEKPKINLVAETDPTELVFADKGFVRSPLNDMLTVREEKEMYEVGEFTRNEKRVASKLSALDKPSSSESHPYKIPTRSQPVKIAKTDVKSQDLRGKEPIAKSDAKESYSKCEWEAKIRKIAELDSITRAKIAEIKEDKHDIRHRGRSVSPRLTRLHHHLPPTAEKKLKVSALSFDEITCRTEKLLRQSAVTSPDDRSLASSQASIRSFFDDFQTEFQTEKRPVILTKEPVSPTHTKPKLDPTSKFKQLIEECYGTSDESIDIIPLSKKKYEAFSSPTSPTYQFRPKIKYSEYVSPRRTYLKPQPKQKSSAFDEDDEILTCYTEKSDYNRGGSYRLVRSPSPRENPSYLSNTSLTLDLKTDKGRESDLRDTRSNNNIFLSSDEDTGREFSKSKWSPSKNPRYEILSPEAWREREYSRNLPFGAMQKSPSETFTSKPCLSPTIDKDTWYRKSDTSPSSDYKRQSYMSSDVSVSRRSPISPFPARSPQKPKDLTIKLGLYPSSSRMS